MDKVQFQGQRLLWLIRLRFIALFSQLPLTLAGRFYGYLDQKNHIIFGVILVVLLAYNSHLYYQVTKDKNYKIKDSFLTIQVSIDLIVFSYLLHLTGGVNNPFYAFFYVMAVFGGIFTEGLKSFAYFFLLLSCVLIIQISPSLSTNYAVDIIFNGQTFPYLVSQLLIPAIVFLIARSFGGFLNKSQKDLLNLTIHSERLDRLRAVGALSAGFSHEFASPLQAAKIRLNRLSRIIPPENEDLTECSLALEDCDKVLKQMNSAQLEVGHSDYDLVDLSLALPDLIKTWKLDYQRVEINYAPTSILIKVPKINFTKVFFNLMDNAAESMNGQGLITISTYTIEESVILSITDQGEGFNPEVLSRIGEPFNTNKASGTGLGLYSTSLFMESVAGKFSITNLKPTGSKIDLAFPAVGK